MAQITTVRTKYGFEYYIGSLCIARAKFVKRYSSPPGTWAIELTHMDHAETSFGSAALSQPVEMGLRDVFAYLNQRMNTPHPTPYERKKINADMFKEEPL